MGLASKTMRYAMPRGRATASVASGPQFYVSQAGGGSGLTAVSPTTMASVWTLVDAVKTLGPTVNVIDGTMTGANSMITPPNNLAGTALLPITIQAINDGSVTFDGQNARASIFLSTGNNYFLIQGFNCKNGGTAVSGVVTFANGASNNILRRVCAWDAPLAYNMFPITVSGSGPNSNNNLIEDCAAFGRGRKGINVSQGPQGTIIRRCWARFEGCTSVGPKGTFELDYAAGPTIAENCLCNWTAEQMPLTYLLQNDGADYPYRTSTDSKSIAMGSTLFNTSGGSGAVYSTANRMRAQRHSAPATFMEGQVTGNAGNTVTILVDQVGGAGGPFTDWDLVTSFVNHNIDQPISYYTDAQGMSGGAALYGSIGYCQTGDFAAPQQFWSSGSSNRILKDCAAFYDPGAGSGKLTFNLDTLGTGNSAINLTSFAGASLGANYGSAYGPSNCVNTTLTPAAYYPVGQSLYSNDGTRGAQIRYRYVNGILTSTPLWPWPMNARIIAATTASGHSVEDINATIQAMFGTFI